MQVSGRPLQLMMLLERLEKTKYYPSSTVTDSPSELEQLVSDSNKQQTPLFGSKLGPQSQRDSHKSHLQPKSHRSGTAQVLGNPPNPQLHQLLQHLATLLFAKHTGMASGYSQGFQRWSDGEQNSKLLGTG